jgi:hypothetical protein
MDTAELTDQGTRRRDRKLFLDDTHIFSMEGLHRVAHPAEDHPGNPLMVAEHPWEGHSIQLYGNSVFHDPAIDKFRMYYLAHCEAKLQVEGRKTGEPMPRINFAGQEKPAIIALPAYAESEDGLRWQRVMMEQANYDEHKTTNLLDGIVWGQSFEPGMLYDPVDPDPARRYKCISWDQKASYPPAGALRLRPASMTPPPGGFKPDSPFGTFLGRGWEHARDGVWESLDEKGKVIHQDAHSVHECGFGLYASVSPDGINWQRLSDKPVFYCYSDTGHSILRDPRSGRFVCYGRLRFPDAFPQFEIGRAVARIESDNLVDWSVPEMVLIGDPGDPAPFHVNEMPVGIYEGMYVGVLEVGDGAKPPQRPDGPLQLACSQDGVRWHRVAERTDFLVASDDADGWNHRSHLKPGSALIPHGDRVYLYYSIRELPFNLKPLRNGFGVATWRRDGFVSLHGGENGGELLTQPFTFDGTELHLNLRVANGGEAEVVVCDQHGQAEGQWMQFTEDVVRSRPLTGDHLDLTVPWQSGKVAELLGLPCTLRVKLRKAHLYSFWTSPSG